MTAYTVVVSCYRKLVNEHIGSFLLQILGKFQFNTHPMLVVTQIPDALTQNGIHHRSDFILSAPNGIKVSHSFFYFYSFARYSNGVMPISRLK